MQRQLSPSLFTNFTLIIRGSQTRNVSSVSSFLRDEVYSPFKLTDYMKALCGFAFSLRQLNSAITETE